MEERRLNFNLYLISDRNQTCGRPLKEILIRAFNAGVRGFQVREKDLTAREVFSLSKELREALPSGKARLFINDRIDIALAAGADGVHLGQQSITPGVVRSSFPDLLIGVSTHNLSEALAAERGGADFITFGPVYATPSKIAYGPPLGINALSEVCSRVSIPVFAIGGINKGRVREVIRAGAYGVALISAILGAYDIENEVDGILQEIFAQKGVRL